MKGKPMDLGKKCRHCKTAHVSRPRGLCWQCYYTPGVADLYPSTSKFAVHGVGAVAPALKAAYATDALPGSDGKVAVMEERAELGQELYHPHDAKHAL